jgi:hypothetical protein
VDDIRQGRIIHTDVPDRYGVPKRRPVIIVTPNDDIETAEEFFAVCCSHSSYHRVPWLQTWTEIPHHRDGRCPSKLCKPTVACCDYIAILSRDVVFTADLGGLVVGQLLKEIVRKMTEYFESQQQ